MSAGPLCKTLDTNCIVCTYAVIVSSKLFSYSYTLTYAVCSLYKNSVRVKRVFVGTWMARHIVNRLNNGFAACNCRDLTERWKESSQLLSDARQRADQQQLQLSAFEDSFQSFVVWLGGASDAFQTYQLQPTLKAKKLQLLSFKVRCLCIIFIPILN